MKRLFALVFLALFLLPLIASCAQETPSPQGTTGEVIYPSNSPPSYNSHTDYRNDRLPGRTELEAMDFFGSEIQLLSWRDEAATFFPDGDSETDPLQSKLYNYWLGVQERFGVTVRATYVDPANDVKEEFLTTARAEGADYELIQAPSLVPMALAMEGRLCNLQNLGYPDLAMPWWPSALEEWVSSRENFSPGGLYFVASNSSAGVIANMSVIFADEQMIADKGGASPVRSVQRGTWTVEEMTSVAKLFAGTAATPVEERVYGLVVDDPSRLDAFYYACNLQSVKRNEEGISLLGYDEEAELTAISGVVARLEQVLTGRQTVIREGEAYTDLRENKAALFAGYMDAVRAMDPDGHYVVIPLPMLDTMQYDTVGYRTTLRDCHEVWCIPTTTSDRILSGMIMEGNASSEYRLIAPLYYEQYLKDRYASNVDGRKCFDILRESLVFDFGLMGRDYGLGAEGYWRACFYDGGQTRFQNCFAERYRAVVGTENDPNAALASMTHALIQYTNQ